MSSGAGTSATRGLDVRTLGLVPYAEALDLQRALAEERIAGHIPDTLLLLEHPPVITLGRGTKNTSLPIDAESLRKRGIEVVEIERGGDVTYHGPGQLVGYPIIDLQQHTPDLHWYLRRLEAMLIAALGSLGIPAQPREGYTGVWTSGRKIASIGIHVRQWVTWHGFALNVTTDLSPFSLIVPCGIPDVVMTSVEQEMAGDTEVRKAGAAEGLVQLVAGVVTTSFRDTFGF
ncbi:MAG TPA: lipoyl(octanoyl) transferase LipB [Gemmatimonadales bacterium]|jgi:lipoate-protein ligase B